MSCKSTCGQQRPAVREKRRSDGSRDASFTGDGDDDDDDDEFEWEEQPDKPGYEEYFGQLAPRRAIPARPVDESKGKDQRDERDEEESKAESRKRQRVDAADRSGDDVASASQPPKFVPAFMLKNPKPGEVRRNETREELRRRAPVVEPQPVVKNWGQQRVTMHGSARTHRFYGEGAGEVDVESASAVRDRLMPELTKYAVSWDGKKR